MYHIAICDDDKNFINYIKEVILISGINKDEVLFYEYMSGEELIDNIKNQEICDLLILDIQMKQLDGNKTAVLFREKFPVSTLVFCSGVYFPTDESFKVTPFRYLLKSYTKPKMQAEIKDVIKEIRLRQSEPEIVGKYYYSIIRLKPDDIMYIENAREGSILHVREYVNRKNEKITSNKKVDELFKILHSYGFAFARSSYIVNVNYVVRMESEGTIQLTDDTIIHVSRSKLKEFRNKLSEWLSRKY